MDVFGCGGKSHCLVALVHLRNTRQISRNKGERFNQPERKRGTVENRSAQYRGQLFRLDGQPITTWLITEIGIKSVDDMFFVRKCWGFFLNQECFSDSEETRTEFWRFRVPGAHPGKPFIGQSPGSLFPSTKKKFDSSHFHSDVDQNHILKTEHFSQNGFVYQPAL